MKKFIWRAGIDEAGRGPLAGPVSVGVCAVQRIHEKEVRKIFKGVKESKQLSEKTREEYFARLEFAQKNGLLNFSVGMVSAKHIDEKGIVSAIKLAMKQALSRALVPHQGALILLDGSLYAPPEFKNQKTIIKGDEKEWVIALASIAAKVTRDRYMIKMAKKYPQYGFEIHKGYGTKSHYSSIHKNGVSALHRKTWISKKN
ncbi:MAG: ribonuclease HII [Candidatus Paceibacterota bacterium]|jgi:ribonuclease HII